MDTQQPRRRIPSIQFRVLIIGRANAGKTSILQRVCETTESPIIYRGESWRNDRVRRPVVLSASPISLALSTRLHLTHLWIQRGEHTIKDELTFSNHMGFVFHDSCGIESGSTEELGILQEFIRRKCGERGLRNKLHAIWYCIPMDNQRPGLDLKFFNDICPDKNVPVIAVFTKYDHFRRNVQIDLDDYENQCDNVTEATEKLFQEHYLHPLGDLVGFVRLEQMHKQNQSCDDLIEKTAAALNEDTVALMLLAVQKGNLELSVKTALNRLVPHLKWRSEPSISTKSQCIFPQEGQM
ncbi:hypothetical protein EDB86DRAFT_2813719 [Lactarius hatsudake]|nr:hypothetical protein EDB86DRAFT_2813719 [Lactarius hatsudake]